jgi:N-methylhydantoinase A/oxoprolinase/acetone carboxylase beta subunit
MWRRGKRTKEYHPVEVPDMDVVCSHEVANIRFMERENASILNVSILKSVRPQHIP